jgi:hypothetical protein
MIGLEDWCVLSTVFMPLKPLGQRTYKKITYEIYHVVDWMSCRIGLRVSIYYFSVYYNVTNTSHVILATRGGGSPIRTPPPPDPHMLTGCNVICGTNRERERERERQLTTGRRSGCVNTNPLFVIINAYPFTPSCKQKVRCKLKSQKLSCVKRL